MHNAAAVKDNNDDLKYASIFIFANPLFFESVWRNILESDRISKSNLQMLFDKCD